MKNKNGILPPTYFFLLFVSSAGLNLIFPIKKIIVFPYNWLGLVFLVFGIILNLWTDSLFKKAKTTVKPDKQPSKFVIEGPFKISRHPMYLGMLLILLGESIILGSMSVFIFPVIFIIIIEKKFISLEEENMIEKFGEEYENYKKRTRKWI